MERSVIEGVTDDDRDLPPQIIDARLGMFYGFAISVIAVPTKK